MVLGIRLINRDRWLRSVVRFMVVALCWLLVSCSHQDRLGQSEAIVAVLPFANFTEELDAAEIITPLVAESLRSKGFTVVSEAPVENVLYKQRVRQTAMISRQTAEALAKELGVEGVMLGMITSYQKEEIPQVGVSARLLAVPETTILWAYDISLSGEDFTGPLSLGTVYSIETLRQKVVQRLVDNLAPRLVPQYEPMAAVPGLVDMLTRPETPPLYRDSQADFYGVDSIAVLPFLNASGRPDAGFIVATLFVSTLHNTGRFRVVEPGIVRDVFLRYRIPTLGAINWDGLLKLRAFMKVQGYVFGTVYEYIDGVFGRRRISPEITISARMVRSNDGLIVWTMEHGREGDDLNLVLDFGRIYSIIPLGQLTVSEMIKTLMVAE